MDDSLRERCRGIDWLLLDVDGVLTDGHIVYTDGGKEIKAFHVRDGTALKMWRRAGKKAGLLTGRRSNIVERRAQELEMSVVVQGCADKGQAFADLLQRLEVRPENVAFIGDDLVDLPVLDRCGLAVAVADGCPEVVQAAHYVTEAPGGRGAVREVVELVLRAQDSWQDLVAQVRSLPPQGTAGQGSPAAREARMPS